MLYDGVICFVQVGIEGIEEWNYEKVNINFCKVQVIVYELIFFLNFDYFIFNDFLVIYEYLLYCLIDLNIYKKVVKVKEVVEYLKEFCEIWIEVSKILSVFGEV